MLLSAQSRAPGFQGALGELYRIYWYPLYAYVRRRGHTPEETQDLTQGFFLHLLEQKTLGRADPFKRKFHFLSSSIGNYDSSAQRGLAHFASKIAVRPTANMAAWILRSCPFIFAGSVYDAAEFASGSSPPSLRQIAVSQHL